MSGDHDLCKEVTMSLTFSIKNYPTGTNPSSVAIGDLNGDGQLDLVTANIGGDPLANPTPAGTISVLLGSGGGTFSAATPYPTGSFLPFSVAIGDLNGDGKLDLAVANYGHPLSGDGAISVFLGNGDGTFSAATPYPTLAIGAQSVAIGDLNGDGKLDLVVAYASSKYSVFLGIGNGSFNQQTPISLSGNKNLSSVAIADLNGDGKLDLALANAGSDTVSVFLGNGNGSFQAQIQYATGTNPDSVAIGDLNGDGQPDLAIANYDSNTVSVLLGNVGGGFQAQTQYPTGTNPSSVAIGDLNGDGRLDLAVANFGSNNVTVLLSPNAPADHDFNGDGNSDVLWRHDSGQVYFWEMDGLGVKAEGSVAHAPVPNDWHIQGAGDFDGD